MTPPLALEALKLVIQQACSKQARVLFTFPSSLPLYGLAKSIIRFDSVVRIVDATLICTFDSVLPRKERFFACHWLFELV